MQVVGMCYLYQDAQTASQERYSVLFRAIHGEHRSVLMV